MGLYLYMKETENKKYRSIIFLKAMKHITRLVEVCLFVLLTIETLIETLKEKGTFIIAQFFFLYYVLTFQCRYLKQNTLLTVKECVSSI